MDCDLSKKHEKVGRKKLLHFLAIPSVFRSPLTVVLGHCGIMAYVTTLTITAADTDATQPLEPAFENLLRTANLHEDVISALRKEEILDRELFVALDSTEGGLAASAKDAFGVDPSISFAQLKKVWNQVNLQVDAIACAHGEPTTTLTCDWVSFKNQFQKKRPTSLAHLTR